jgi:hypothetical protein
LKGSGEGAVLLKDLPMQGGMNVQWALVSEAARSVLQYKQL